MIIQLYEGYLRNRQQLCHELGLTGLNPSADRTDNNRQELCTTSLSQSSDHEDTNYKASDYEDTGCEDTGPKGINHGASKCEDFDCTVTDCEVPDCPGSGYTATSYEELNYSKSKRRELECRVIEAGYERWGYDLPRHLHGYFAFAIWDESEEKLFCARDAFGVQTMYYQKAQDGTFLYGADLRTIVNDPHYSKSLDTEALQLYLLFGYPVGEKTLYQGIRKLMPGCSLIWDEKAKSLSINRWYTPSFHPDPSLSEEEWIYKIDHLLQDIINEDKSNFDFSHCKSFLSGGVDSSYLLASSGVKEAIGIGFEEADFSEAEAALATADSLGASFKEDRITADEFFGAIPQFLKNVELPLADPCAPAFALGCDHVAPQKNESCAPCISGEGADEFFAGYYVYRRAAELGKEGALYCGCSGVMEQKTGMQLLGTDYAYPMDQLVAEVHKQTQGADPLSRMLAVEIALWLEGDILFGVGRSSRAWGIDLLLPFIDQRMFDLSAAIPSSLKRKDEIEKYILRKAAAIRLPEKTAFRKKVGFSVPVRKWFREERFRPQIEQALFGQTSKTFFNQEILHNYWSKYLKGEDMDWMISYAVYIFIIWYENCY